MKNLFLTICICVVVSASGCATAGSGACGTSDFSLFQSSAPRNQPFRDCVRNWFRGDECDTCNAPTGLSSHCGSNVAPLCESNVSNFNSGQPIYSSIPAQQPIGQGVQLYSDPNLNIGTPTLGVPTLAAPNLGTPILSAPNLASPDLSSNLIDPLNDGGNLGVPSGTIETGYGSIPSGSIEAGYGSIPTPSVEPGYGEIPMGPSF